MSELSTIRQKVCDLNVALQTYGLVAWTSGNVSERLPGGNSFIIKPSGVKYESLRPIDLVICDLNGDILEGSLAPSSDTKTHAYIYREMSAVNGIVHTHSNYASAWAAANQPIPCALTAMADEFGGDIPLGPFALIGGEEIGQGVVATLKTSRSPAVLMANHGVFTIGNSASSAVKAAVMCEDVAKTMFIASQLGELHRLSDGDIEKLFNRYQNFYGQSKGTQK
jgi:L-ribulose-5-phosphate 4-epimerase